MSLKSFLVLLSILSGLNTATKKDAVSRHFSSPYSQTAEDPVTGSASGVMAAYLHRRVFCRSKELALTIQQGKHVDRIGELQAISTLTDSNKRFSLLALRF